VTKFGMLGLMFYEAVRNSFSRDLPFTLFLYLWRYWCILSKFTVC